MSKPEHQRAWAGTSLFEDKDTLKIKVPDFLGCNAFSDGQEMINLIESEALLDWMNATRDPFRGYYWERRSWRANARPASRTYTGMTRQRVHDEYEPGQLDYSTGLPMQEAVRQK